MVTFARRLRLAALAGAAALLALPGVARAQDPSFTLVNNTGRVIQEAYASPSTQQDWGADRLGADVVQPGRTYPVRIQYQGECVYDVRVVMQGGGAEERRGINLCEASEVAFGTAPPAGGTTGKGGAQAAAPTGNPSFNLVNRSGRTIREFYASAASRSDWGPDVLGAEVVAPGRTFAVRLPEGECIYDLRVVYDNNQSEERRGLNTCDVSSVTFP